MAVTGAGTLKTAILLPLLILICAPFPPWVRVTQHAFPPERSPYFRRSRGSAKTRAPAAYPDDAPRYCVGDVGGERGGRAARIRRV